MPESRSAEYSDIKSTEFVLEQHNPRNREVWPIHYVLGKQTRVTIPTSRK